MSNIKYNNKTLQLEQVKVRDIATVIATPFYCYSSQEIRDSLDDFTKYIPCMDFLICYALKANSNVAIIEIMAQNGLGADCVSAGEIKRAINAGIPSDRIVFSGVGKDREEISFALVQGILQFNVESIEELILIDKISGELAKKAKIALRINPDIDAKTHSNITTGTKNDKFGIESELLLGIYEFASSLHNVEVVGISIHIGSQITSLEPFIKAFDFVIEKITELTSLGYKIKTIDVGGGLGVKYHPQDEVVSIDKYMELLIEKFSNISKEGCKIIIEPGRALVAKSGILVSKVLYNKQNIPKGYSKNFLIIDAGMNNFMRSCLYGAYHEIVSVDQQDNMPDKLFDVVGPICESSDSFAKNRALPQMFQGDLVAILDVGAYGSVMSSHYNSRNEAAEIMIDGDKIYSIKKIIPEEELGKKYAVPITCPLH